jgi:hypothetical protein
MKTGKISVTITGPEGMLEAMAKLLRDEGYTVSPPGLRGRKPFTDEERVLRASRRIARDKLDELASWGGTVARFANAELARRGLKP